ncbi:MAG: hypothetical protein A3C43_03940 [Candidatus Schekmanbacteria bacterium RIFCSPHIGHO2_02_FULL_38_11]|uniref:Xylose isomerase-like TIM barrel domain-containing protein n=1 Tax=Candidatus Schekmanbacteria bacterium RIFCSPLOWO2_12_FULL_38_15 TaxID=1817883 RepID=A0A1F7SGZ4_9BACT|nr:MAG: hypothetical protein A2043_04445 [Candidatus Schekmanbacteria bacterium GWA2_38_9]OGL49712.1 MAG: hypothetical protein A3H37_01635 [Candidatus Schekmanbacteria bacterium RIFCSPLOWO2_02_FULL_38_14]OGL53066.1 MAG: hypothetical protein A3G31_09190 [Candidatus Schekmanbacteria bacterium RIFCSPLOWO2_12_FULL_38_15]OGL53769.1 MAG: hypothetical protein A3C43_03940 [Candidatus Schekmanbacteria bacterium RIFCSPHIGHO2_02_FULL_38_11]
MANNNIFIHIPYKKIAGYKTLIFEKKINLEIYFSGDTLDEVSLNDIKELSKQLSVNGIRTTFHSPFHDLSPGGFDKKVREATVSRLRHVLEIAEIIHPENIVVHPGFDSLRFQGFENVWFENSLITWKTLLKELPHDDIFFTIENVFEEKPDRLVELVSEINSKNFKICFDIGHFNVFGKIPLEQWINSVKSHLKEIHIHDNNGTNDDHIALGEGGIDFKKLFSLTNHLLNSLIITVEAHSRENALKSLAWIEKNSPGAL